MGLFDWFAGGKPDLSRSEALYGQGQDYMKRIMEAAGQPGAREQATAAAYRRAQQRLQGQTAGAGGQAGALAQQRQATMTPMIAQQETEAMGAATAADIEAQRAAEAQAMQQQFMMAQAIEEAKERYRQQRGAARRGAIGGLFDIGTKVAPMLAGGAPA